MADIGGGDPMPVFRKKRKMAHPRQTFAHDHEAAVQFATPGITLHPPAIDSPDAQYGGDQNMSTAKLKESLRLRQQPHYRSREIARKAEEKKAEAAALLGAGAPRPELNTGRFVAQTGQRYTSDDKKIAEYLEAQRAEKNHREHGWPIPQHLEAAVAALEPLADVARADRLARLSASRTDDGAAATMGKLHEVDLGPEARAANIKRTETAIRRMEGKAVEDDGPKDDARPGKRRRRRWHERRNSEDERRDKLVDAVLAEAKFGYFHEEDSTAATPQSTDKNADEVMAEQFRREFLEAETARMQPRKPAMPPSKGDIKDQPKGPKMGGSRSARAAAIQRAQEEQDKKMKR